MSYEKDLTAIIDGHIKEMVSLAKDWRRYILAKSSAKDIKGIAKDNDYCCTLRSRYMDHAHSSELLIVENFGALSPEQRRDLMDKTMLMERAYADIMEFQYVEHLKTIRECTTE